MEFGIFNSLYLPHHLTEADPVSAEHNRLMDEVAWVRAADRAGFKYTWATEHHFLTEYSHLSANESFLAYSAALTNRIHIGTGIFNITPPVNHPARIAERVAILDHLSGGRFEFGMGRGSSTTEQRGFGITDPELTREMFDEVVPQFKRMWRETDYSHEGRFFSMPPRNVLPKPHTKPHPAMWVAAGSPSTFEKAARMGLGVLCFTSGSPASLAPLIETYKKNIEHAEPVGEYINNNIMVTSQMLCLEDGQKAHDVACNMTSGYQNSLVFRYLDTFPKPPGLPDWPNLIPEPTPEGLEKQIEKGLVCIGTPDEVEKAVRGYADIGADQLVFGMLSTTMPIDVAVEAVETFGKHLIPMFDTDPIHSTTRQREAHLAARASGGDDDTNGGVRPLVVQALAVLNGLRVVDATSGIAGGYCTKLLADAGADVVIVEPAGGHPLRRRRSGALYEFLSTGKTVGGDSANADIVVADVGPDTVPEPGRVHVTITPFGTTGPWAGRPATEFTLQAWCGSTGSRGIPEHTPLAAGGDLGEFVTGSYAAVGALAAWRAGGGEHVDVAMFDCMSMTMNTFTWVFSEMLGWPELPPGPPRTVEIPSIEPAADGWVGFCTITAQQFQDFLVLIERPDWLEDASLRRADKRFMRRDEMWDAIHDWTAKHTIAETIELASLLRIPVAPIGNGAVLPTFDHFVERGVFEPHPGGRFIQPRVPYKIHGAEPHPQSRASRDWERPDVPNRDLLDSGLPLAGIRVIDFTAFWAGPAATQMLAALGADVVKIESVQRPDGMRFTAVRPPTVDQWWEWGPVFHGANTGKRSVTLDLTDPEGVKLVMRLVEGADAVVENFTPRVLENFGLTWDAIHAANPRAVLVRMPGFGLDGPWRDRTGFAQTMEQISGLAWVTGDADGPPVLPRGACDPMAGMHAVFALMVALEEREHSGQGRLVEVTMVETALNAAAEQVVEHSATGVLLERSGNGPAPRGVYACLGEDAWVAIDPVTVAHHAALPGDLEAFCASRSPAEVVNDLWAAGVPVAEVISPRDVLHNPQLAHRELFETVDHPVCGAIHLPGAPFRFSSREGEGWLTRPAPLLGEHTREVLGSDLGVADDELDRLQAAAIIGTRPVGL